MGILNIFKKTKSPEQLLEEADKHFKKGEIAAGYALYEQAAKQGNADAQFEFGMAIIQGKTDRPVEEGVKWLQKAVDQDYLLAINNLAICYQQGIGVNRDDRKAFSLLSKAVYHGDIMAEFNVGQAYYFGLGVERDLSKAFEYINRAAKASCANAQYMLGQLYENGEQGDGVDIPVDKEMALTWYKKAAKLGYDLAIQAMTRLEENSATENEKDSGLSALNEDDFPIITNSTSGEVLVRADIVSPDLYSVSDCKYIPADGAVGLLYAQVKAGSNPKAQEILLELAGNHWNKLAFNALNELGMMGDQTDDNTRRGYAQFMLDAWRQFDREKLQLIAFWSYPKFCYSEYNSDNKLLRQITDESLFVDYLMEEMEEAHRKKMGIRMRIREEEGDYLVDVMIGSRVSTFKFLFGERSFIGVDRYWDS